MRDPELNEAIRRRVSRLSNRDLRRVAAGSTSGQETTDAIVVGSERELRHNRARRLLLSYLSLALAVGLALALLAILFPSAWRQGAGLDIYPEEVRVDSIGGGGMEVMKTSDGTTWLIVHNPPRILEINGQQIPFETTSGWVRLNLGKVNEVAVNRDGSMHRFVWSESGWKKR